MGFCTKFSFSFLLICGSAGAQEARSLTEVSANFRSLSARVSPSVVRVVAIGYRVLEETGPSPRDLVSRQQRAGSGTIISTDGYIVTNAHVVLSAEQVQVTLPPGQAERAQARSTLKPAGRTVRARIVGLDLETDIALLRISETGLPALALADSDEVEQGQVVLAFGSPLGLDNSVSMGVVSSTARQLRPDDPMVYIQTDASINPGNSGGPLVDSDGRVVGINTLILSQSGGSEGLSFAVPSSIVRNVVEQLRVAGEFTRGETGATLQTITPELAAGWRLPRASGAVVADVIPASAAALAGLREGDVIAALDGKPVENARQFNVNLYRYPIGSSVLLDVVRDQRRLTLTVKVIEQPAHTHDLVETASRAENLVVELGVFAVDLTAELREQFGVTRTDRGVLIASRLAEGPLMEEAFEAGDIICAVNREPVAGVAGLRAILRKLKSGEPVAVQIERAGKLRFLAFGLP